MPATILLPRLLDADNLNAQATNAKALLERWQMEDFQIRTFFSRLPDEKLLNRKNVELVKVLPWRFWRFSIAIEYQRDIRGVFYPHMTLENDLSWRLRDLTQRRVPIIATIEGLPGDKDRERSLSAWAGHEVYCQRVDAAHLASNDRLLRRANHIFAISPFLADMAVRLYGQKVSVLSLGVDRTIFHSDTRATGGPFTVIGVGSFWGPRKRHEMFLEFARRFPAVKFKWFGEGTNRHTFLEEIRNRKLRNLEMPGAIAPEQLAEEYRRASLFVLPSYAEGVPKVSQEAAACGVAVIQFGFYRAPTVVDGRNGYVVWSDKQLLQRVEELITDTAKAKAMGEEGARMACQWDWSRLAPQWESSLRQHLGL